MARSFTEAAGFQFGQGEHPQAVPTLGGYSLWQAFADTPAIMADFRQDGIPNIPSQQKPIDTVDFVDQLTQAGCDSFALCVSALYRKTQRRYPTFSDIYISCASKESLGPHRDGVRAMTYLVNVGDDAISDAHYRLGGRTQGRSITGGKVAVTRSGDVLVLNNTSLFSRLRPLHMVEKASGMRLDINFVPRPKYR